MGVRADCYATTLALEFDQLEPENEMKWLLRPSQDRFDFAAADELVRFAKQNGMLVRGHTLLWHQAVPKWLGEGRWTWNDLSQLMAEHIQTVVKHFAGSVYAWDVVNEAFHPNGRINAFAFPWPWGCQAYRYKPGYARA